MDKAKQHWEILQGLGTDLANRVREFMVVGMDGEGVIVVTEDGMAFWLGEICYKKTVAKPTPLNVPDLDQMAQGRFHILLLNKRGEIYSMGRNHCGQLGLGTVDQQTHFPPKLISSSQHKFISVRCGMWHSLALTEDGKVWAWGDNLSGQVGMHSSTRFVPSFRQIPELDLHRIVAVECGGAHSLALTDQGEVYAWGWNGDGQLGDGNGLSENPPKRIPIPSPVQSMAAGNFHTLLLTQTGEVWACGGNEHGQLGLPITTKSSARLSKVAALPLITQIASHPGTSLSIAMSSNQRCFVWGQLPDENLEIEEIHIKIFTPFKLPLFYSTLESPFSSFSTYRNTPHSVSIPETSTSFSARISPMFNNPETSPDVQFVVEQRTIHAHRCILSNSSDYFARMFSERWMVPVDPEDPIIRVTITDHSYQAFYTFLRFLYTDCLECHFDLLPELFELANLYLVPELQQLCLLRMRTTLSTATCCLYYPLTLRLLLPELATFQQELVQFASKRMSEVEDSSAFQSMEPDLRVNLSNAVQNIVPDQDTSFTSSMDTLFDLISRLTVHLNQSQ